MEDLSNKQFNNYNELCDYMNWKNTGGKVKKYHLLWLEENYNYIREGQKYIIKEYKYPNETKNDFKIRKENEKLNKIIDGSIGRNAKYLKNNLIIFQYIFQNKGGEYPTTTMKQMKDFGFLQSDISLNYDTSNCFVSDFANFSVKDKVEKMYIEDRTIEYKQLLEEVFDTLKDRVLRMFNSTYNNLVDFMEKEKDVDYSKTEWKDYRKYKAKSANYMYMVPTLMKVTEDGKEVELTAQEKLAYFKIKDAIFKELGLEGYSRYKRMRGQIFSLMAERCKEKIGSEVVFRQLFFSMADKFGLLNVTEEDWKGAIESNKRQMRETIRKYLYKKYLNKTTRKNISMILYVLMGE